MWAGPAVSQAGSGQAGGVVIDAGQKQVVSAKRGYRLGVRQGAGYGEHLQVGADFAQDIPTIDRLGAANAGRSAAESGIEIVNLVTAAIDQYQPTDAEQGQGSAAAEPLCPAP